MTLRRLQPVLSLLCLFVFNFVILSALPGGPLTEEAPLEPAVRSKLETHWDLAGPWYEKFFRYFIAVLGGDWGFSLSRPDFPVRDLVLQSFFTSLKLGGLGFILSFSLGIGWALFAYKKTSFLMEQISLVLISVPLLFLAPFLMWIFAFYLGWLPAVMVERPQAWILPVICIALRPSAVVSRIFLRSLKSESSAAYLRTAKAKGLTEWRVLLHHQLRNSFVPIVGHLPQLMLGLLSGSFIVETLFSMPGAGRQFVLALEARDYPVISGLVFLYGAILIVLHFLSDEIIRRLDPRVGDLP
ncbi:MAG: ABC transporter permease [Bdellovibrionaceae bacterium]|nr:ABC transporter permease [Pseudobdellovibrionaceae bacterium]